MGVVGVGGAGRKVPDVNQDERARLTAERDRLRDALRRISEHITDNPFRGEVLDGISSADRAFIQSIARAALAESEETT